MRSAVIIAALSFALFAALVGGFFGAALLGGEQFAYRDAGHYYYPLYQRVQEQWSRGYWPLWDPGENAGVPLLANPTAAVLYPGKLIFALLPYPIAAKYYIIGHVLLAFGSMFLLMRGWQSSLVASTLSAMAYAFGAPVLFQTCNVVFLVGASWAPLGFLAAERWISERKPASVLALALVLSLQFLGGDPESAYLTGLCSVGLALVVGWGNASDGHKSLRLLICGLIVAWIAATLAAGYFLPGMRTKSLDPSVASTYPWQPWVRPLLSLLWLGAAFLVVRWGYKTRSEHRTRGLGGLVAAGLLAGWLTSAQLLPTLEYGQSTSRSLGSASLEIFSFSLEPIRIVEFLWPQCFGSSFDGNHHWLSLVPSLGKSAKVWVPSLYVGGITLLLALSQLQLARGSRIVVGMSVMVLASLVLSLGEYAGPLCWVRQLPIGARLFGPNDPAQFAGPRLDGYLRDGEGSPYWLLSTLLPGFGSFRYPSKLLTFTTLGLSVLAGLGWDALAAGHKRTRQRLLSFASLSLAISVSLLVLAEARRESLTQNNVAKIDPSFGPLDLVGASTDLRHALIQGAAVASAILVVALGVGKYRAITTAMVVIIAIADLLVANRALVVTVPQAVLDQRPEALRVIEAAEKARPEPGPYRVYRAINWEPRCWALAGSAQRVQEIVSWERDTLQPKHGLPEGVESTFVIGAAQFAEYAAFFEPHLETTRIGPGVSRDVVVHPRRAHDLWNTRYFILPSVAREGGDRSRGISSFLPRTELIYPAPDAFAGPEGRGKQLEWARNRDFQIRRNLDVLPRAWVVHDVRPLPRTPAGKTVEERLEPILFSESDRWRDPTRARTDLRRTAWVLPEDLAELVPFASGNRPDREEAVTHVDREPNRVQLRARLAQPGLVVVSDVFAPGWKLEIDGAPAPIYCVNGLMRGAAVPAGDHQLVFSYQPRSFWLGLLLTGLAILSLSGLFLVNRVHRRRLHGINKQTLIKN